MSEKHNPRNMCNKRNELNKRNVRIKSLCLPALILLCLLSFALAAGCSESNEDLCFSTEYTVDTLEKRGDASHSSVNFNKYDDFFSIEESKNAKEQYENALIVLSSNPTTASCMGNDAYKVRIMELNVKYGFLDLFLRYVNTDKKISNMIFQDFPEFQTTLNTVIKDYEAMRTDVRNLQVAAESIDQSKIPQNSESGFSTVKTQLDALLKEIDSRLSLLYSYR